MQNVVSGDPRCHPRYCLDTSEVSLWQSLGRSPFEMWILHSSWTILEQNLGHPGQRFHGPYCNYIGPPWSFVGSPWHHAELVWDAPGA
eukprot:8405094-Karenia_brevis.AAC.1